jgi:hypothetical protein
MRDNHRVDTNDINLKHSSPKSQTVPKTKIQQTPKSSNDEIFYRMRDFAGC